MPGADLCIAELARIQEAFTKAGKEAVKQWGDAVMEDSKNNYVPVLSGQLRDTGIVTETKDTEETYEIQLSYSTPYAAKQHEDLSLHHDNGQGKYLSAPLNAAATELVKSIERSAGDTI